MANDEAKRLVGTEAAKWIQDGMTVGLGTGSTVYWTLVRLGQMVADGMQVRGISTSVQTEEFAARLGIPLISFEAVQTLDLTIDGADEIDSAGHLIKGGGGALLREKVVAQASRQYIIVADATKRVEHLGAFPLPVEIVRFGWQVTKQRIEGLGCTARLRSSTGVDPYVTDNGNYIVDCSFGRIDNPEELQLRLKAIAGVVETGLFTGMNKTLIVASDEGVEILSDK